MADSFRDSGFIIKKNRFSDNKLFIDFFTRNNGKITALAVESPSPKANLYHLDIFSFFDIDGTIKSSHQENIRINYPQLTPHYDLNQNSPDYAGFLFITLWCEILSYTKTDEGESTQLYDCSTNFRNSISDKKNALFYQAFTLFLYFKYCHLLFNYRSCEGCGQPAFIEKEGELIFRKAQYVFQPDQSLLCDNCVPKPYLLSAIEIKICTIFNDLNPVSDGIPNIPEAYLEIFILCMLNYFKWVPGLKLKTETMYISTLSHIKEQT